MPVTNASRRKAARRHPEEPSPEALAFTVPQAAERLGVSVRHVYRLLAAGALPRARMGGATRINRAAVEAYAVAGDQPQAG